MSYLVFARKYRPRKFCDVIGQELVVRGLTSSIKRKKIASTFIFSGNMGTGKTTVARLFAKSLICKKGITVNPCLACHLCISLQKGTLLDVLEIDGASNTGIDDVRALKEIINYQPSVARFRVIIIDEIHMLSISAFNALLKTIEEPPNYVKFIFVTTEINKVPLTILSRCQRYNFLYVGFLSLTLYIERILKKENRTLESKAVSLIVRASKGSIRDALNLVEQTLYLYGGKAVLLKLQRMFGMVGREKIIKVLFSIVNYKIHEAMSVLQFVFNSGLSLIKFITDLAIEIRNFCLVKSGISLGEFYDLEDSEVFFLRLCTDKMNLRDLERLLYILIDFFNNDEKILNCKIAVEFLFLKMLNRLPECNIYSIASILSKLESIYLFDKMHLCLNNYFFYINTWDVKHDIRKKMYKNFSFFKWRHFINIVGKKMKNIDSNIEYSQFVKYKKIKSKVLIVIKFNKRFFYNNFCVNLQDKNLVYELKKQYGDNAALNPILEI